MNTFTTSLLRAFALLLLLLLGSAARAGDCSTPDRRIDGGAIVRLLPGASMQDFLADLVADHPGLGAMEADVIPGRPIHLIALDIPKDWTEIQRQQLAMDLETAYLDFLAWGEALYENEAPEGGSGSTFVDGPATATLYRDQYGAQITGLGVAHAQSAGGGVVVAVLDTGIDMTHPELADRIAPGGYDFVDEDSDPSDTAGGADEDGDGLVDEGVGHGTFVAGLISLAAPDALLLPVRVLNDEGRGDMWILTRGIFYAVDRGVEVINLSLSSTYNSEAVEDAIEEARNLGIVTVAAAGNCDRDEPREFPAMRSNIFGVAATDEEDRKADFSNFSDRLLLSAPGAMAFLAGDPDPDRSIIGTIPGGGYAHWEGTSFAAPFVSGVVALVRAQHPEWPANESTYDALEGILTSTAEDIDDENPQYQGELGEGRVDAAAAVAQSDPAPQPGDLDGNGVVNVADILLLLNDWGEVHSSADLDGDGMVGVNDLIALLANWTL